MAPEPRNTVTWRSLVALLLAVLGFFLMRLINQVDAMDSKFVSKSEFAIVCQYVAEIRADVKELLKSGTCR